MELSALSGNERLKEQLSRQERGRGLSHAYIVSGPAGSGRHTLARQLAAAMLCTGGGERPCGRCGPCSKVLRGVHPDVSVITGPEEGKPITVEQVRALRSDAYIRPNEGRRKVYIFPDCALLTEQDQNVLLKLVEEGPPYAAFLFCAENPAAVLQTLRSRCVELRLHPASGTAPAEDGDGEALCRTILKKEPGAAAELAVRLERKKLSREALAALLERSGALFSEALVLLYGGTVEERDRELAGLIGGRLTKTQIVRMIELLKEYRRECGYNVGPGHVLGALAAELEEIF